MRVCALRLLQFQTSSKLSTAADPNDPNSILDVAGIYHNDMIGNWKKITQMRYAERVFCIYRPIQIWLPPLLQMIQIVS